jgi:NADH dehydrogenase
MKNSRITLFGATGFVGRHLSARLLDAGHHLTLVARHPSPALPAPRCGAVRSLAADILARDGLPEAVQYADAVVNLVGAVTLPNPQAYFALHEQGARNVTLVAKAAGVKRLIHISALGIAPDAPSAADRSKAAGERAVREVVAEAVIVRPSLVYGAQDHYLQQMNAITRFSPVIPLIGSDTRFQPVHVGDLTQALVRLLALPDCGGNTYQIGGPEIYTQRQLVQTLLEAWGRRRLLAPLPYRFAFPISGLLGLLPRAPLNREMVALMLTDKVAEPTAPGLNDLGISARSLREWIGAAASE